jgi:hypothetical protein
MASSINASTSGAGGVITTADNTGILNLQTASTTAVTIDASQNVGIGTTSPSTYVGQNGGLVVSKDVTLADNTTYPSNNYPRFIQISGIGPTIGGYQFSVRTGGNGSTAPTERMRINETGNLLVGTTSLYGSTANIGTFSWSSATTNGGEGCYSFINTSTSTNSDPNPCIMLYKSSTTTTSSQRFLQFSVNGTAQPMGGIVGNGATNVQFASLSDAREKTNIEPITGSLDKILALKPSSFDLIADNSHVNAGFIAQEVQTIFPEFVVDNIANEGQPQRFGLTGGMTGGIIPHLVKAIQEQQTIINDLKARVTALEAK